MAEPVPSGYVPFGVSLAAIDLVKRRMLRSALILLIVGTSAGLAFINEVKVLTEFFLILFFLLLWLDLRYILVIKGLPIALNPQHPWFDLDTFTGDAEVMIWTEEKSWFSPGESTIRVARDPLGRVQTIVANDENASRWGALPSFIPKSKGAWYANLVNSASVAAMVANGGAVTDSFADAQEREDNLEFGLLEREWGDTTPGELADNKILKGGLSEAIAKRRVLRSSDLDSEDSDS